MVGGSNYFFPPVLPETVRKCEVGLIVIQPLGRFSDILIRFIPR